MVEKHQSSIFTFVGIYLAVSLLVGGAVFFLYRSGKRPPKIDLTAEMTEMSRGDSSRIITKDQSKSESKSIPEKTEKNDPEPEPVPDVTPEKPVVAAVKPVNTPPPKPAANPQLDAEVEAMFPIPKIRPLLEIVGNWKSVPKKAFPPFVKIRVPVEFDMKRNGAVVGKGKLPIGSSMIPLLLVGDTLTLSNSRNSNFTVYLSVSDTDFRERIQARYDKFVVEQTNNILAQRSAEKDRRLGAIKKESGLSQYNEGDNPRFDPVKASIRRGEAGFFQIESAQKWRWAGMQMIDGENFDVAFVMMVSESAFGTSERELKALIQKEKVVSWLDVATGEKL